MASFRIIRKYPGLSTLLILELLAFIVVSYQVQVEPRVTLLDRMGMMVFGPIQQLSNRFLGSVSRTVEERMTNEQLLAENLRLRQTLTDFETLKTEFTETEMENDRLRAILSLPKEEDWRHITAEVIGRAHRRGDFMVTINKGYYDGVQRDMGVRGPDGVVGIVWEVSPNFAKIMTVNNPSAVVASLLQRSRYLQSYTIGLGADEGRLNVLERPGVLGKVDNFPNFESVITGDLVLTSGLDGVFPKGVEIGTVTYVEPSSHMFQSIRLRFNTDFDRLETVTILVNNCKEELDDLD